MIEIDFDFEQLRSDRVRRDRADRASADREKARAQVRQSVSAEANRARRANRRLGQSPARKTTIARLGAICEACGWAPPPGCGTVLNIHHIVPIVCGGKHHSANLTVICPNCHAVAHKTWRIYRLTDRKRHYDGPTGRDDFLSKLRGIVEVAFSATSTSTGT